MTKKVNSREIHPFKKDFEEYIEDGIWPIVQELNLKGYYTVDSCQGHFLSRDIPHVAFCINNLSQYPELYLKLKTVGVGIQLVPKWFRGKDLDCITPSLFANQNPQFVFVTFNSFLFALSKKVLLHKIRRLPDQEVFC